MMFDSIDMTLDHWTTLNQLMNLSSRVMGSALKGRMELKNVIIEWDNDNVKIIVKGGEKG